jgi:cation diffusion facilitator CzcD-associated flavoprotein CzcO
MGLEHFDVLIVGAGLSGIGAGVHLGKHCPDKTYVILENRDAIGGTWDLFRYPGVRSDSDMFTLGYAFKPWTERKAIADGPSIWKYVNDTARDYGVAPHVRFKHKVIRASWDSQAALWTIEAEHGGALRRFTAKFLLSCAGYYNYEQGYQPAFEGMNDFNGRVIHPQHWPQDFDYSGKRIVVIGSGATAVTLVPSLTDKAAHVTMLQRSPTYMVSMPAEDKFANRLRRVLPARVAYDITRFLKVTMQQIFFRLARTRPEKTRNRLQGLIAAELGEEAVKQHFTPRYNPWEQRLCLVPDNDMFIAIRDGKASVVTDEIVRFTATGLALQMFGGAELVVDGAKVDTGKVYAYKGCMYSDVPNFASVFGYTNASWTLRADLISEYVCRLINYMDEHGLDSATPRMDLDNIEERPFVDFSSGYFERVKHILPRQTSVAPWKQNQSYLHDLMDLRFGVIDDHAMHFARKADAAAPAPAPERSALTA